MATTEREAGPATPVVALGATPAGDGSTAFAVWAPNARGVAVLVSGRQTPLELAARGCWVGVAAATPGDDYLYVLDGDSRYADPCSRHQPEGVRGPSRVVAPGAADAGAGLDPAGLVVYELHVGTFTREGTLDAALPRLRELAELGVTAVELMPLGTFPGVRGWGYDGLYTFAPHAAYGGPEGLRRLVGAAREAGLGVIVDVVYNHLGPGNEALRAFGPYTTGRFGSTPWGEALDFTAWGVREWAIQNAEMWVREYGVDGLRLDAVHAIHDPSPEHVLHELARRVRTIAPRALVISEMGRPDFAPLEAWDHDAMWLDNLHHELHVALTGERDGYYADFTGAMSAIARELQRPQRPRLVVAAQNHDQVGNRALGDRLPPRKLRLAQAVVLFSPLTPLLFQGEEYAETRPFQYFTDHIDPEIAQATRAGRRREFAAFVAHAGEVPDPQALATFERSKLDPEFGDTAHRRFVQRLLRLRPALEPRLAVRPDDAARTLELRRGSVRLLVDFERETVELRGG